MIYVFLMLISTIVFLAFVSRIEQLSGRIKSLESEKKSLEDKLLWAEPQFVVIPQVEVIDSRSKAIEATGARHINTWRRGMPRNRLSIEGEARYTVRSKTGSKDSVLYAGIAGIKIRSGATIDFLTWEQFYEDYPDETVSIKEEREVTLPFAQYEELKKSHETLIGLYSEINSLKIPTDEELQERVQT